MATDCYSGRDHLSHEVRTMLKPASLKSIPCFPVTTSVATAALVVTGSWWSGRDMDWLVTNARVWERWELWRGLTSTLPHVNFLHLAFNLYWFWVFGTLVERVYGHLRFAGIIALLALGSSLAEFMLFDGGVGLSGVGYGLWALLWVLQRRDARFAGAVDRETTRIFVAWFFVCIVLTVTDAMPVGNVAHGAGAGLGALLGLACSGTASLKRKCRAGLVAALVLTLAGSTIFWPRINLSPNAQAEVERAGVEALDRDDNEYGRTLLETSVRMRGAPARAWYNLGIAYQRLGRHEDALEAYERAAAMPDSTSEFKETARRMKEFWMRSR